MSTEQYAEKQEKPGYKAIETALLTFWIFDGICLLCEHNRPFSRKLKYVMSM